MSGIDVSDVTHAPFPESFRVAVIVVGDFVLFGSVYVIFARTVVRGLSSVIGTWMLRREHATPEKVGVKFAITGGRPTMPESVTAVSAAPRVVANAGKLNFPSARVLAAARAKVTETV